MKGINKAKFGGTDGFDPAMLTLEHSKIICPDKRFQLNLTEMKNNRSY